MKRHPQIFMGPGSQMSEDQGPSTFREWTEEEKKVYLDKVRQRAQDKAQEILTQAMQEAENIREQARTDGYEAGMSLAEEERREQLAASGERLHSLLLGLEQEKKDVWQDLRTDILSLVRLSVEKVLRVEMSERREEILSALLDEAVGTIEDQQSVRVYVHPDDMNDMQAMLTGVDPKSREGARWQLHADPELAMGGVRLESAVGITDNSIAERKAEVDAIWDKISLNGTDGAEK